MPKLPPGLNSLALIFACVLAGGAQAARPYTQASPPALSPRAVAPAQRTLKLPPEVAAALAQAGIPQSHVGVLVQEVGAARPLLAINAEQALNPGSVMKLVTTYAGLSLLGPAYAWRTDLMTEAPLRGDVLDGDLYLKGNGDPGMTLERFWLLLRDLRARGVRDIRGDLVIDDSYFSVAGDPAQFDGKADRPYNTVPGALVVNFNTVRLRFVADAQKRGVQITVDPPLPEIAIDNKIVLDTSACNEDWPDRLKLEIGTDATGGTAVLHFSGPYAADCAEKERSYSVLAHGAYTRALFALLWRELGGSLRGGVRNGTAPAAARVLAGAASPPLGVLVRDINKFSNNLMARQTFLTLGAVGDGAPGTTDKGAHVIAQWLAQRGLVFPELVLENGAGLSRNERISARSLAALLLDAQNNVVVPEFMASLPIAGLDGTMRKRLTGSAIAGQAHIKTGSLEGVRAIAGYVRAARGEYAVVVFLVNDAHAESAGAAQDVLLGWVYQQMSK